MANTESSDMEYSRLKGRRSDSGQVQQPENVSQDGLPQRPTLPLSVLGQPALRGRGNSPVHSALMQRAQKTHGNRAVKRELSVSKRTDPSEVEAERAADSVLAGARVEVSARPTASISRFGWEDALAMGTGGIVGQIGGAFAGPQPPPAEAAAPIKDEGLWDRVKRGWGTEVKQEQGRADEIDKFRHDSIDNTVDWLEGQAHKGGQMGVEATKDIPVINQLAKANAAVGDFGTEVAGGFIKGAGNFFGSVGQMAANPLGTAKGLWAMSTHIPGLGLPSKILDKGIDVATGDKKLGDAFDETLGGKSAQDDLNFWKGVGGHFIKPYGEAIDKGKYGEVAGRAIFDIGSLVAGAGEAKAGTVTKAAEAADTANAASKVVEGVEGVNAVPKSVPPPSGVPTVRNPTPFVEPPPGSVPPSKLVPSTSPPGEIPPPAPSQGPPTLQSPPTQIPNAPATNIPAAPKTIPAGPPSGMPEPLSLPPSTLPKGPATIPEPPPTLRDPTIPPSTRPAPSQPPPSTIPSPPENLPTTHPLSPGELQNPVIPPHPEPPGWASGLLDEERFEELLTELLENGKNKS